MTADQSPRMNGLYVAEPTESLSGAMADHRLAIASRDVAAVAQALAARLGLGAARSVPLDSAAHAWIDDASADLLAHHGNALVLAGESQAPPVHARVAAVKARPAAPNSPPDPTRNHTPSATSTSLADAMNPGRGPGMMTPEVTP